MSVGRLLRLTELPSNGMRHTGFSIVRYVEFKKKNNNGVYLSCCAGGIFAIVKC